MAHRSNHSIIVVTFASKLSRIFLSILKWSNYIVVWIRVWGNKLLSSRWLINWSIISLVIGNPSCSMRTHPSNYVNYSWATLAPTNYAGRNLKGLQKNKQHRCDSLCFATYCEHWTSPPEQQMGLQLKWPSQLSEVWVSEVLVSSPNDLRSCSTFAVAWNTLNTM